MSQLPRLLILASGTITGGGSGCNNVIEAAHDNRLQAQIVGVVSQHAHGGVNKITSKHNVPFYHLEAPYNSVQYTKLLTDSGADFTACLGWLKHVTGLDPQTTINTHPGPLPLFGGHGMYGIKVHQAVLAAYQRGDISQSEVCMHFVTEEYDRGPVFFRAPVPIHDTDTPESLRTRVQQVEHKWHPRIINHVINGNIAWDGHDPASLTREMHVEPT